MSAFWFIWAIVLIMAFDVFGRVLSIISGDFAPVRKPRDFVLDLAINSAALTWGIAVLILGSLK